MSAELCLDTGLIIVALTVPDTLTRANLASISAEVTRLLPGGWRIHPVSSAIAHVRIIVSVTTGHSDVELEGETVRVTLTETALASPTLAYVTYTVTERARQQLGMVTAHAAAVITPDGKAVVLLGDKGAGKTTTAFSLVDKRYRLLGDDLIILAHRDDGLEVMAGRKLAAVRRVNAVLGYEAKRLVDIAELTVPGPVRIATVVRVSVHPAVTVPTAVLGTPLSVVERLRLHENLARYIAGTPTPLTLEPDVYGPVYALDTPACAATRAMVIDQLGGLAFHYVHAPTAEHAAGMIEELTTP